MADFETELRLGEDTAIFDAEDAFEGEAVGDAEGLLDLMELEETLAAEDDALLEATLLDAAFDKTAEERLLVELDFGVVFNAADWVGLDEAAEALDDWKYERWPLYDDERTWSDPPSWPAEPEMFIEIPSVLSSISRRAGYEVSSSE